MAPFVDGRQVGKQGNMPIVNMLENRMRYTMSPCRWLFRGVEGISVLCIMVLATGCGTHGEPYSMVQITGLIPDSGSDSTSVHILHDGQSIAVRDPVLIDHCVAFFPGLGCVRRSKTVARGGVKL
jgi:hypothetical protein